MFSGDTPKSSLEKWLLWTQPRLLVSRKTQLTPENWQYDICSPFWRLYVNQTLGGRVEFNGHWLDLRADTLYLIPAWLRFRTQATESFCQHYLHFEIAGFPLHLARRIFGEPQQLQIQGAIGVLCEKWSAGIDESGHPAIDHYGWAQALMHAALAEVMANLPEPVSQEINAWLLDSVGLSPALDRIEREMVAPPDNSELAALCGLSVPHFARRFKAAVGVTPAQYRLERRIITAARLLAGTERKMEEIAEFTGFTDRFYFTKMFKSRLGVSPAAYRRIHRVERNTGRGED
jgi:AraC-like DNA-binding protein